MKQLLLIFLSILVTACVFAQGINKNGKITNTGSEYVNKNGAIGVSEGVDKNGRVVSAGLPSVTTTAITLITTSGATTGGNVTSVGSSGITTRGICWSTEEHPIRVSGQELTSGIGLGSFTAEPFGLLPNTTYYIRAFAYNDIGTAYGNELSFTTYSPLVGGLAICDGTQPTTVVEVTGIGGAIWMDRNLGASRAATSPTDYEAYGCLYQWGRGNDGHASITWTGATSGEPVNGTTATLSVTDIPGHSLFIGVGSAPYDWRSTRNNNLWQGVAGVNNPCPAGFRPPTLAELETQMPDYNTTVNGALKFSLTGYRDYGTGILLNTGGQTPYFSSTVIAYNPYNSILCRVISSNSNSNFEYSKSSGYPVRCIKN